MGSPPDFSWLKRYDYTALFAVLQPGFRTKPCGYSSPLWAKGHRRRRRKTPEV
jgi:hypothetical protein